MPETRELLLVAGDKSIMNKICHSSNPTQMRGFSACLPCSTICGGMWMMSPHAARAAAVPEPPAHPGRGCEVAPQGRQRGRPSQLLSGQHLNLPDM